MNTLHFKYVAEVAKTGSITQAAENLYMAQPNLSKAIKELEETLGISIFRRTSKGVVLTEKGEEFLVYAKRVLTQIGKMEALSGQDDFSGKRMSLCLPGGTYISYAFQRFVKEIAQEGELELRVKEADFLTGANWICDGEVSFGFLRVPTRYLQYFQGFLEEKDLRFQTLWEGEYLVVFSENHPLAKAGEITTESLTDFVEIACEEGTLPTFPGGENDRKIEHRKITVHNGSALLELVAEVESGYVWTSPMPSQLLSRYGLVQRTCQGNTDGFCDLLVYPKDYLLTPLDRKLVDTVSVTKNGVVFGSF